jgi:inosine/xanthosine triphosphate pyrophosphatase family protein
LESFTCQKNDGENIKIYEGLVEGKIIASEDISSFDYYFEVTRFGKKLGELKQSDLHPSLYSARAMAAKNLRDDKYILSKKIEDIPVWTGKYQG